MSVIGRLDEQVNDILITPLEQRRDREPAPEDSPQPPTADVVVSDETSPPRDELPVWLL